MRDPVSSYGEARAWLFKYASVEEWFDDPDALPLVARFVCDAYWVTAATLCRDLRRDWFGALDGRPVRRGYVAQGWRA